MAEPTTEEIINGLSNYDLTTYVGMSKLHDIAHWAASRLALLSHQNDGLGKSIVEKCIEAVRNCLYEPGTGEQHEFIERAVDAIRALDFNKKT
jgi:hypothetical protein